MPEVENKTAKRICIATTIPNTIKAFALETAKFLHENCGYDITFICNYDEDFEKILPDYIHYKPVSMSRGIDFSGFISTYRFFRIFRKEKFDMVQYATPNASCYASIAAFLAGVPIRLYSQWGIRYVGLSGISRRIFKFLEKMVCTLSTDVRAVSHLNKAFSVSEKLYKPNKAKVVGNGGTIGVDMSVFDIAKRDEWRREVREKHGISENEFLFGFAGRISVDKGCGELLAAFKSVAESNDNVKLLAAGRIEAKTGIDPDVQHWAETSGRVLFPGKVPKEDMKKYYSAMDVLVHPTYREGFGMVIQEAGALALPVITTKIPGASEVMVDGESCYLVEPKNVEELRDAMLRCINEPQEFANIGKAAYERTAQLYNRPIMLENQKADYIELLEKR